MRTVRLAPMTQVQFDAWLPQLVAGYAGEKVTSGNWIAEGALERSQHELDNLLGDGLATADHHFFAIYETDTGAYLGLIWLGMVKFTGQPMAFIYDFQIFEPYRRQGYGVAALHALEDEVRALGFDAIGLHVFGHNRVAQALYEKAGYQVTNVNMQKRL